MKKIVLFNKSYHKIYETDKFFKTKRLDKDQYIIVDSGCPRSLMGEQEYSKIKAKFRVVEEKRVNDYFRFGPSRVHKASLKVSLLLRLGTKVKEVKFFVVEGSRIPDKYSCRFQEVLTGALTQIRYPTHVKLHQIGN